MRIILLSGAVKNAGDYLITHRTKELFTKLLPTAEQKVLIRNVPMSEERFAELNDGDLVVISGGPVYKWDFFPKWMPLTGNLSAVKPKMAILGGGWYGSSTDEKEVWNYKFNESTMELLRRVEKDTKYLGCRDYYAARVLRTNGIKFSTMTGCPAWYDVKKIGQRLDMPKEIRKIAVSDPAEIRHNGEQSLRICEFLKKKYPGAEFHYVFHRGTTVDKYTDQETVNLIDGMKTKLLAMGYTIHDIASGYQGFHLYDDCDLHVGHRVHAHIYNLSQRNASILIEEDARGAGVNEPLGLWSIKAYSRKKGMNSSFFVKAYNKVFDYTKENPYVLNDLESYLANLESSGFIEMNQAYAKMEFYFERMVDFVEGLAKQV